MDFKTTIKVQQHLEAIIVIIVKIQQMTKNMNVEQVNLKANIYLIIYILIEALNHLILEGFSNIERN